MPSSMTHGYFCEDVYKNVNASVKNKLKDHINYFKVFGQGPDPYFFYDFHLSKKSRQVHEINRCMQHTNINKHFIKLINYINENSYYSNRQVMAYLYGQLSHFVLDSTAHPYIIYYTGVYDKDDSSTYKYNGLHEEMEYYIDCYLIWKREKVLPKKFKVYKELFDIDFFDNELKICIDDVVKSVYNFNNVGNIYFKSLKDMKKFYYVFNYDRFGIKKFVYSIMDIICGNMCVKKKELSFNVDPLSKIYYLNDDKTVWNNPCDKNEKYNLSFEELYNKALNKACIIINEIDDMLKDKKIENKKIEDLLGNLHYGTGKDCDLNLECKYFKF